MVSARRGAGSGPAQRPPPGWSGERAVPGGRRGGRGPAGHHNAAWRLPDSRSDEVHSLDLYLEMARTAERGKLDVVFLGDLLAVWPLPPELLARTARAARFEPLTVLGAMAAVTERIGLVATASTSFNEPFTIARQFGSLDHMTGGPAGWDVRTSLTD